MARYLSEGWFREVNDAARNSASLRRATAGAHVTLQQVVTNGPDGDIRYWLRVEDGSVEAVIGDAQAVLLTPDATITQSYATAVAVNRGELSAQDGFLDGSIRLRGDIAVLLRHQSVLSSLGDAFAEVRDRTEYP